MSICATCNHAQADHFGKRCRHSLSYVEQGSMRTVVCDCPVFLAVEPGEKPKRRSRKKSE